MQKANAVGGVLSILTAVVWLLVGVAGWSVWIGVVFSMVVGGYWAFGRQLVAGEEMGSRDGRLQRSHITVLLGHLEDQETAGGAYTALASTGGCRRTGRLPEKGDLVSARRGRRLFGRLAWPGGAWLRRS